MFDGVFSQKLEFTPLSRDVRRPFYRNSIYATENLQRLEAVPTVGLTDEMRAGFISADADYTGGELVTRPLTFTGSKLQLNTDTGSGGTVRVEILDEDGESIPGFELKGEFEDIEIEGNHIRVTAQWPVVVDGVRHHTSDVSALEGRPIRLRFVMRNARLYSCQFTP